MEKPRFLGIQEYPLANQQDTERSRPLRGWLGGFNNPWDTWQTPNGLLVLRWKRKYPKSKLEIPDEKTLEKLLPVSKPAFPPSNSEKVSMTWLGHASCLFQLDGVSILADPVFEPECSTFQSLSFSGKPATTPRFRPSPCQVEDLPQNLKFILISHNHFDHMDLPTCLKLHQRFGDQLVWCVPLGNEATMRQALGTEAKVIELDWWQCAAFKVGQSKLFEIVATPCQHWCMRKLMIDKMMSLWCSFSVIGPSGRRVFFAGDTGYCKAFKEIGRDLGPFDIAAIPIGAYDPHEFLAAQHVDPNDAVQLHKDIGSRKSVGVHWGTFPFADDSLMGPKEDLEKAVKDHKLKTGEFIAVQHGETVTIDDE